MSFNRLNYVVARELLRPLSGIEVSVPYYESCVYRQIFYLAKAQATPHSALLAVCCISTHIFAIRHSSLAKV